MYQLKRIVVSVDLSDMDEEVIRYTSIIAEVMDADTIYFLHVAPSLDLPDNLDPADQSALAPVDETIRHEVQQTVDKYFQQRADTKTTIDVMEGKPTEALLKYAKRKEVDMVVVGKPGKKLRSKVHLGKIAELSTCSALFVPKGADIQIKKMGVAVDFSEHAKLALEQALRIAEESSDIEVYGFHVYRIPHGYSKTGKSYEEFAQIMKKNAEEDADRFFKKYNSIDQQHCQMLYELTEDKEIHDELNDLATGKNVDMLLIGSQGRTAAASMLLGSVSEELLHYENKFPLFIVKEKDSNMGFFEALFKL